MSILPVNAVRRALLAAGVLAVATVAAAIILIAAGSGAATAAQPATQPPASASAHSVPAPVPVSLDPATTAYLVLDDTAAVCTPNPSCVATLPAAASLLARARAAGATVIFSKTVNPGDQVLSQVAPLPSEHIVAARADKFFGTDLQQTLTDDGIKTLVLVGTKTNGAIMYTAFEASVRGFTVVVAEDGVSSNSGYIQRYSLYQLLNVPGFPNAQNTPLLPGAVTLSTTKLVSFTG